MTDAKKADASQFEMDDATTARVEIYDPRDGTDTGLWVDVVSVESTKARELQRKVADRRLSRMQRRGGRPNLTSSEIEAEAMAMRVACTVKWFMLWAGKELDCTPENVEMVYTKAPPIRNQVDQSINDIALFTRT
jgi:hypothetical protein